MKGDSAPTTIEYALITACISLAPIVVLQNTGFVVVGTIARFSSALGMGGTWLPFLKPLSWRLLIIGRAADRLLIFYYIN